MDLLSNPESIQLEAILNAYKEARRLTLLSFPERDLSGVEAEMNWIKEQLEDARCDSEFRLSAYYLSRRN